MNGNCTQHNKRTTMSAEHSFNLIPQCKNSKGFSRRQRLYTLLICLLVCLLSMSDSHAINLKQRQAVMWEYEEWTLENTSWNGNPFDVIATVTFVHSRTGLQHKTQMFYAGNNQWKFRFTGTRTGAWSFSTFSSDPELDGHTGSLTVGPRSVSNQKGFLSNVGNKYAIMVEDIDHLAGYVYQVFMNQQDFEQQHKHSSRILGHPNRVDLIADYWNNTRDNGFDIYFFAVFYSWFRMGALSIDDFTSDTDPDLDEPDLALFDTLELAIRHAHERGGRTHIWAWGDNDRRQTPNHLGGGIRGIRHQRLMRYIAARLGPLPGWTMSFGFDTIEMPDAEMEAAWWASELKRMMGWPHMLMSRGWENNSFGANSYAGFGGSPYDLETTDKGPVDFHEIRQHLDAQTDKPSIYEERHTYNRWQCWPEKVIDPDRLNETGSRRLIWWQAMAGGMGGFFGHFSTRFNIFGPFLADGPCGYHPESLKQAFRTHREFWRDGRLKLSMSPDNCHITGTDAYCLASADSKQFIFFAEDTNSVTLNLRGMPDSQRVIAVDTRAEYDEKDLGSLMAGIYKISLDTTSDWVIAVGSFDTTEQHNGVTNTGEDKILDNNDE